LRCFASTRSWCQSRTAFSIGPPTNGLSPGAHQVLHVKSGSSKTSSRRSPNQMS
jgi:hypothetical protein